MKLLHVGKDGGPESNVTGYWLIEWKRFFSIALLRFDHGSREAFHSHAFNCISWLLKGELCEEFILRNSTKAHVATLHRAYIPSYRPIITKRETFHRVFSIGTSWVLTFRGPWAKTWQEYDPVTRDFIVLGPGREKQ